MTSLSPAVTVRVPWQLVDTPGNWHSTKTESKCPPSWVEDGHSFILWRVHCHSVMSARAWDHRANIRRWQTGLKANTIQCIWLPTACASTHVCIAMWVNIIFILHDTTHASINSLFYTIIIHSTTSHPNQWNPQSKQTKLTWGTLCTGWIVA